MSTFNAGAIEANLTLDRSSWVKDYRVTLREIERLEDTNITIGVDADTTNADIALDNLERNMDALENDPITIGADADFARTNAELELLEERLDTLDNRTVNIGADADTTNAMIQLSLLEDEMDLLEKDPIDIQVHMDVDRTEVIREVIEVVEEAEAAAPPIDLDVYLNMLDAVKDVEELEALSERIGDIDIDVDVDSAGATAQLAAIEAEVKALDGQDIDIDVDVDHDALDRLAAQLIALSGPDSGGGHMGLLRLAIYALLALSPLVSVALTSMVGGALALGGAMSSAAGAAGILGIGVFGLVKKYTAAKKAGDPLTDGMQHLDDALTSLKDTWNDVIDAISVPGFELMADALGVVDDMLPGMVGPFKDIADAVGGVIDEFGRWVNGPEFDQMMDFFGGLGADMLVSFMHILGDLMVLFGHMFDSFEPVIRSFMGGLEEITQGWADWSRTLDTNKAWQEFMEDVQKYGPMVIDFFEALWDALLNIGDALEPFAGPMLTGLTNFFNFIADMDTDTLTLIIGGLVGLWGAFNIGVPILSAIGTALTVVSTPLLLIIGAIAVLAFAIYELWQNNETFRTSVIDTWNAIVDTVGPIIEDIIAWMMDQDEVIQGAKDTWNSLKEVIVLAMQLVQQVVGEVLSWIVFVWERWGDTLLGMVGSILKAVLGMFQGVLRVVKGVIQFFLGLFTGDWKKMGEGIKNILGGLGDFIHSFWQGIIGWLRGLISIIGDILRRIFDGPFDWIRTQMSNLGGWIRTQWNNLLDFFRNLPGRVNSAVAGIFDGIGDAFRGVINDMIGWWNNLSFSVDIPDRIPGLPDSFTVNTPDIPMLAEGAWINEPTLAVIGEGTEPEIVTPESKMREIVSNYSSDIDYGRLAAAVADAFADVLGKMGLQGGLTQDDLASVLAGAGANIRVDATSDESGIVAAIVNGISFELRRLGFGGKANV